MKRHFTLDDLRRLRRRHRSRLARAQYGRPRESMTNRVCARIAIRAINFVIRELREDAAR